MTIDTGTITTIAGSLLVGGSVSSTFIAFFMLRARKRKLTADTDKVAVETLMEIQGPMLAALRDCRSALAKAEAKLRKGGRRG